MSTSHRHFYYWCFNCATRVHVETDEHAIDDSRDVMALPDVEIPCPMCTRLMFSWDEIAARDESFRNHGDWEDFERWRAGAKAKKDLLLTLATILSKDDDLSPDDMPREGYDYESWDAARNELVEEFERRAKP